jgi:mono/diheme cytochrome c family protein
MINRINTVLAVLLVAVVVMTVAVGVDYSQPNIEILPDMKYTPAWEAFAANPNFPNGQTMQPPVPGTIARGHMPLYYTATKEDAVRAGEELENPSSLAAIEATVATDSEATEAIEEAPQEAAPTDDPSSAAEAAQENETARRAAVVRERFAVSVERGGEVYHTFCISCHGPKGAGDGLVTQRGFPPPPSMLTGKSLQMKDGQLFHILTYGQGSMAPMAAQLSRERRWDVINYVRDLQSKAPAVPETEPAAIEATSAATSTEPAPQAQAVDLEPTEKSKEEEPKTPPNELRESRPDSKKQTEESESRLPADDSEPTTDAES